MTLACPVCRADNTEPRSCRRCKADLGLLWDLESERAGWLADAAAAIADGDGPAAVRAGTAALKLRDGVDASRFIACGHLLAGDFANAAAWHRRAV